MQFLIALQSDINAAVTGYLAAFAEERDWLALAAVLPLGILFGAVHAITPGHGKTILASYLVGSRLALLRGIATAAIMALTHVGLAVVIAVLALPLVTRTLGGAGQTPELELVSRAGLILIGAWLVARAMLHRPHAAGEGLTVAVMAGLIPCPLTLFVMFYALARGVPEAGLTFALAMGLGILLLLSSVALVVVLARDQALRLAARFGDSIERIARGMEILTGFALIVIGARALLS